MVDFPFKIKWLQIGETWNRYGLIFQAEWSCWLFFIWSNSTVLSTRRLRVSLDDKSVCCRVKESELNHSVPMYMQDLCLSFFYFSLDIPPSCCVQLCESYRGHRPKECVFVRAFVRLCMREHVCMLVCGCVCVRADANTSMQQQGTYLNPLSPRYTSLLALMLTPPCTCKIKCNICNIPDQVGSANEDIGCVPNGTLFPMVRHGALVKSSALNKK